MTKYFKDYLWEEGFPFGVEAVESITDSETYKIISDPYKKRISIEKYVLGQFSTVVYDSVLLDFRQLKQPEQTAWQKIPISEDREKTICLIRNQDDRVLFVETHYFENGFCRECRVESPHEVFLSTHRMYYTFAGDPFNGVVLFDQNEHPVMLKKYVFDELSQQFTDLLEEDWKLDNGKNNLFKYTTKR